MLLAFSSYKLSLTPIVIELSGLVYMNLSRSIFVWAHRLRLSYFRLILVCRILIASSLGWCLAAVPAMAQVPSMVSLELIQRAL